MVERRNLFIYIQHSLRVLPRMVLIQMQTRVRGFIMGPGLSTPGTWSIAR